MSYFRIWAQTKIKANLILGFEANQMKRGLQGKYVTVSTVGDKVRAFVPTPLPPDPPINWTPALETPLQMAFPRDCGVNSEFKFSLTAM